MWSGWIPPVFGAADEARTRYLHLGKVALYQMSYGRIVESLALLGSLRATCVILPHFGPLVNTFCTIFFCFFTLPFCRVRARFLRP